MPLSGQYEWQQRGEQLVVNVPLKGVAPSKVDIYVTSSTLKINYAPFLLDIVFPGKVDSLRHKAKVRGGVLKITLLKAEGHRDTWKSLEIKDDSQKEGLREKSKLEQLKLEEQLAESRKDRKIADERHSVREQMALEESERSRLDGRKEEEKQIAEKEVYEAFSKLYSESSSDKGNDDSSRIIRGSDVKSKLRSEELEVSSNLVSDNDVSESSAIVKMSSEGGIDELDIDVGTNMSDDLDLKYIPPPRSSSATGEKFNINFTPRVFPTPMRESTQSKEEDWIAKNRRHLKKHGTLGKNIPKGKGIDITEEDPAWLKAKGDDFFRVGDYLSAMNAYSAALDIDETMTSCYSNRSACYLSLRSPQDCKSDCTQALNLLMKEESESYQKAAPKLMMRRGIANCQLGLYDSAIEDYTKCIEMLQNSSNGERNASISVDVLLEDIVKLERLKKSDVLKKAADKKFSIGDLQGALSEYSEAISQTPLHVGCLSNRAACKIALKDFVGGILDCSTALQVFDADNCLQHNAPIQSANSNFSMMCAILPARGSEKRKSWYLKTLVRRGAAHYQAGSIKDAIEDYSKACSIDPSNEKLMTDLNSLRNAGTK